ncbi:MAG: hypothetical protein Q9226_005699 [Calogaya cf. arnoldii]
MGKSQRETIEPENPGQSTLSYDELCQSVQNNLKHYTVAQAAHVGKNGQNHVDSALRFGRTVEQFLKDFPGVLGPASALDSQYGGIVLPTISALWQVSIGDSKIFQCLMLTPWQFVSSKQRYEEQMQEQNLAIFQFFAIQTQDIPLHLLP